MCGIFAMLSQGGAIPEASIGSALQSLHHRGPDGRGIWKSTQGQVVLGHTRLSIIDLRTGDQPFAMIHAVRSSLAIG